ncbi:MAG: proline--tRNA ligase [Polyangiaceae bacterium]|nr:proline--tRNA ligase [Polyangiaceae bacterium]MCW5789440.1 proline--tRNA ligase [Polyangiaceae bacterium]
MRYSRALLPTVKEAPADATTASHVLLLRAGYVRRIGAGIYSFLPLGVRVLRKVERVVREEMDRAGAEEVLLPALLPAEYFQETDRWTQFGDTLLRLKDRKGGDYHLGPTHEEIITDLARRELHSYRDLPKNLYQIQTKFRDEPRPRAGLLRCREFLMKDAYSFDVSEEAAQKSYEAMRLAYRRIFDRLGFDYRMVSADSGAMGGSTSAEFQVLVQSGEDILAACSACEYAANVEVAETTATPERGPAEPPAVERVATPTQRTIEEVSSFLGKAPEDFLKSLVYVAGDQTVLAVVRGDHEVNEIKLARALGVDEVHLAGPEEVRRVTGAEVGFAGPVGFQGRVVVDRDAASVKGGVAGANESGFHLLHVTHGRDYQGDVMIIRAATDGDACPSCAAPLKLYRGVEAGHIFILGTHYSAKMGATFLDEKQEKRPLVMGCYGIGVSRLVAAAIEQHHDKDGIRWPMSMAPYHVHLTQLGAEPEVVEAVAELTQALERAGVEVLVDDRSERPGAKFKDADLIGVPLRVTIGARSLQAGGVEIKRRDNPDPKSAELVPLAEASARLTALVRELGGL